MSQRAILQNQNIIDFVLLTLEQTWSTVFDSTQAIVGAVNNFGFDYHKINQSTNPTTLEIINILKRSNDILDAFSTLIDITFFSNDEKYEFERILLNSKQTVLKMEQLMLAMQREDNIECEQIMNFLRSQSSI